MKKSKQTKRALIPSLLAVILCVAMLVGTTFAWFTDTASTSVNKIQAGKLDVALVKPTTNDGGTYDDLGTDPLKWVKATGHGEDEVLWEPGATYNLESFRISNNGNLALKYQVQISGIIGSAELLKAIDFTVKIGDGTAESLANWDGTLGAGETSDVITISGTMKTTAGNEYQGLSIEGIAITVVATQDAVEFDSTTDQYDASAVLPVAGSAKAGLSVETNTASGGGAETVTVKSEQTISDSVLAVTYPANVVLSTASSSVEGGTATVEQKLEYVGTTAQDSNVTISEETQAVASYNLTLPVADTNQTLVTVTIKYTAGLTGVKIYHSGTELEKKNAAVSEATSEYFTYNKEDGTLVLYLKHASPIDIVYDKAGMATVTNQNELVAALADETVKTIVLGSDVSTDTIGTINRSITIDLNSKTLTYTGSVPINVENEGTNFTLKNGSFAEEGGLTTTKGVIVNYENTTTTLDNVTATTDATLLYPYKDASTVTVKKSTITSGTYGVATNAGEGTKVNIKVNIEDSTITAGYGTAAAKTDNCAVIMNVGGTLNITGSTITGDRQGVFLRAGTAHITDSTIKTTGEFGDDSYRDSTNTPAYWKDGNEAPRGALIVGSYNNGTVYSSNAICYLTNTTLVADGGAKQIHLAGNGANSDTNKFCAKVYTDVAESSYTIDKSWGGNIYIGPEKDGNS